MQIKLEWVELPVNFTMSDYTAKLKTAQKWGKKLKVKLNKVTEGEVITKVNCTQWAKHVDSIKNLKKCSQIWIDGLNLLQKGSIHKHFNDKTPIPLQFILLQFPQI